MDLKEYFTTLSKENLIFLTQLRLFYQTVFKYQKNEVQIYDNKIASEIESEILNLKFHTKLTYTPAWVSILTKQSLLLYIIFY